MTRINVVPVETLTNKHLMVEYNEITRPFNKAKKRLLNRTFHKVKIPTKYCLGAGHETFFFDKLKYIAVRYVQLHYELNRRGYNLDHALFNSVCEDMNEFSTSRAWNDYVPTPEDMYLNMARLCKRSRLDNVLDELASDN